MVVTDAVYDASKQYVPKLYTCPSLPIQIYAPVNTFKPFEC